MECITSFGTFTTTQFHTTYFNHVHNRRTKSPDILTTTLNKLIKMH
uniref:Uncharacterized protein n=1 Tax=Rhizophora mucronata TaxID=61149 RepID=A0A2P2Q1E8_RHIMU